MERTVGVEEARNKLSRLADEVSAGDDVVVLTRRGRPAEARREAARVELAARVDTLRQAVAAAGLDESVVDEAIAAARRAG